MGGEQLAQSLPSSERIVWHGGSVCIGQVRCPPSAAHFRNCGRTQTFCIVFPRSAVTIRRAGAQAYIEDPAVVAFYNREQEYERYELSPEGDRCDWFAFAPQIVRDAVGRYDPRAAGDECRPLRLTAAPSASDVYCEQRRLFERVRREVGADPLDVEETAIAILDRVMRDAHGRPVDEPTHGRSRDLAEQARRFLARAYARPMTLQALAGALETSVYHLCRVFRRVHGTTIHRYRSTLRMRRAIELAAEPGADLGQIAFDLGFSTHSHFTAAFRRAFGVPPSTMRAARNQHL